MQRTSFDAMTCSIARTVEILGEWWTPLVLRDVAIGITRFDAIQSDLGISRKVLTQRLGVLVEHGILQKTPYQQNPPRYDYHLTEKGSELALVLLAMQSWGDRWIFGESGPPVVVHHETCGAPAAAAITCSECKEPLRPAEIRLLPGPALTGAGTSEARAALERLARARFEATPAG